ncbi:tRNA dimethylallyltransferase [Sphingomonas gellani]|uniref:tRNA dimethylallyltransferase n=1 Tax=Sphingomonas gellani TaxID=1166340 RepID=A0A1H7Y838_9SPHN|nr:tRNA (adenosine(37)-N6)-dimethylallyltransferase MiaA [Sphingomonas gellani]SEM41497.1 tRNA dimethylallyltransferase [Sphingomonas gellani]
MNGPLPRVALIAGPTASGKSALALMVAERFGGTIINADSAQVYRDLRILTARPSDEEEARVPHRLFGHVDGAEPGYSAARWAEEARGAIAATLSEGRLPILVGGTGMYLRTLLDGIAPVPEIDPTVRASVRAMPVYAAYAALRREDPDAAARLAPADSQRIARALEVVRSSGRPLAAWQAERVGGIGDTIDLRATVLLPPREWLIARIDSRFADMADAGSEEVATLLARDDIPVDAPIRRAIGVPEVANWVRSVWSRDEAVAAGALATRRYAKRQYTWLRHQTPATWLRLTDIAGEERASHLETLLR